MSDFEHHGNDPDDTTLLASAYLDDEATPDERMPELVAAASDGAGWVTSVSMAGSLDCGVSVGSLTAVAVCGGAEVGLGIGWLATVGTGLSV